MTFFNFNRFLRSATQRSTREHGFVIGPLLGLVAVMLIVAMAGYGIFRYISNSFTVTIENTNLMAIVSGAKSLKSAGSYASVDNAALQRIQAFGSMTGAAPGGTVRNRWNGTVVVTGAADGLTIAYNGVPSAACERFVVAAMESGEFAEPAPVCGDDGTSDVTFTAY